MNQKDSTCQREIYLPIPLPRVNEGLSTLLSSKELAKFPWYYRWILKLLLKLPNPSFPYFILRRLPEIEGVFWAVIVPILFILYFLLSMGLVVFLSLYVAFPFNLLIGLLMPAVMLVIFIRIQLERAILWWRNLQGSSREWDISEAVGEFVDLVRGQKRRQTTKS